MTSAPSSKFTVLQKDSVSRSGQPGATLTTDFGCPIAHTDDSLRAGARGPTLMEDFHLHEKLARFDRERIPERVVHARGTGAHGYFQAYENFSELTMAKFLCDPTAKTPVFVRFSTVFGSRGSMDTPRDVRGFAVKFYTPEGNFDLVGNSIPVFFIQDAIKFPDIVHAAKPQPHNEIPQAQTAHDNFWDFISLMPESMHMVMWVLSDRALPRSFSMMQGFGVHTFRLINSKGKGRFVKFHWIPVLGVHSLVWDECQKLGGKDPDFARRDLWEAIEMGNFPEFELAVQIIEEGEEEKFDFDLLDSTKIIPEELVPLKKIGKMVLNRNPSNFFAETEQVAFCVSNFVPGIGPTDDPLMQGRLLSYFDTQLHRLGGPNFKSLPINRPLCPAMNFNSDGFHTCVIPKGTVNFSPNSLGQGLPEPSPTAGYHFHPESLSGVKTTKRALSFAVDHYSQARLFYNSLSPVEKRHLIDAAQFELGRVDSKAVKERVIVHFNKIDHEMAVAVASALGVTTPSPDPEANYHTRASPALSQMSHLGSPQAMLKGRRVAAIVADGANLALLGQLQAELNSAGCAVKVVAPQKAFTTDSGTLATADFGLDTAGSVMFDGVIFMPMPALALEAMGGPAMWLLEAYKHCKTIGLVGSSMALLSGTPLSVRATAAHDLQIPVVSDLGLVTARDGSSIKEFAASFAGALAKHRHWERVLGDELPVWKRIPA